MPLFKENLSYQWIKMLGLKSFTFEENLWLWYVFSVNCEKITE